MQQKVGSCAGQVQEVKVNLLSVNITMFSVEQGQFLQNEFLYQSLKGRESGDAV